MLKLDAKVEIEVVKCSVHQHVYNMAQLGSDAGELCTQFKVV